MNPLDLRDQWDHSETSQNGFHTKLISETVH